ncbi:MAG: hypothetical protein KBE23_01235 [Chloroflexi bacterium]|nr:hypothetical protein [Chloroflexota bacterium]MBP7041337.1 hypothetical protein [Chloroflexota bacterium]
MLEPLRLRVVDALSSESSVTLSTNGPGGIQAGFFPCESDGLALYLLVPASSDVLYNLETETAVIITTPHWQMEGEARVCYLAQTPSTVQLAQLPQAPGCVLVAICCQRIHFNWTDGWGYRETLDCDNC